MSADKNDDKNMTIFLNPAQLKQRWEMSRSLHSKKQ